MLNNSQLFVDNSSALCKDYLEAKPDNMTSVTKMKMNCFINHEVKFQLKILIYLATPRPTKTYEMSLRIRKGLL